jgi:vacuolar-type H+-ATPase subunit E/Vma4
MSLETILDTIAASGEAELRELRREANATIQEILDEAEQTAAERNESTRQAAVQPVSGERARRLHQAKLRALRIVGEARDELAANALVRVRRRLIELRDEPVYANILRHLTEDAIKALGEEELNYLGVVGTSRPEVEVDLRDQEKLQDILRALKLDLTVMSTLNSWGGVIVRSGDGRVVVTNTFESRLERAMPFLRQEMAAFADREVVKREA